MPRERNMAANWSEMLRRVNGQIIEVLKHSTVQMIVLMAVAKAGANTAEAEQALWGSMHDLDDLRRQQRTLGAMSQQRLHVTQPT